MSLREIQEMYHRASKREISTEIAEERLEGMPILSSRDRTKGGYYLPSSLQEFYEYIDTIDSTISKMEKMRDSMIRKYIYLKLPDYQELEYEYFYRN